MTTSPPSTKTEHKFLGRYADRNENVMGGTTVTILEQSHSHSAVEFVPDEVR